MAVSAVTATTGSSPASLDRGAQGDVLGERRAGERVGALEHRAAVADDDVQAAEPVGAVGRARGGHGVGDQRDPTGRGGDEQRRHGRVDVVPRRAPAP